MKKLVLTLVAAFMLGSVFSDVSAQKKPDKEIKKCCQKIKREVRRTLQGPSFEYLKPDCFEEVKLYLAVDKNNELVVVKVKGEDERLLRYVKETIEKKKIEANPKLSGKMFVMDLDFYHQPA